MDVVAGEAHAIDLSRVVVVVRPGVEGKRLPQSVELLGQELLRHFIRNIHIKLLPIVAIDKAAARLGVRVGIGNVRLDVVDGRAIHQVGTGNMNYWTLLRSEFHPDEPHWRWRSI